MLRAICVLLCLLPTAGRTETGAALFEQGAGAEVLLLDGRIRRPADAFACAGCHGADGRGGREGGQDIPPITWAALTNPERRDGGYNSQSFLKAVSEGIAADGRRLSDVMPRFDAPEALLLDLKQHLSVLDAKQRAGIYPTRIQIGAPSDPEQAMALLGVAAGVNRAGGIFGRALLPVGEGDALLAFHEVSAVLTSRPQFMQALTDHAEPGPEPQARLAALMLSEALIACGRDVTRACVLDALAQIDPGTVARRALARP